MFQDYILNHQVYAMQKKHSDVQLRWWSWKSESDIML